MEWKRAWQEERAALMRLVALLHALAGLAERAAGRSAGIRYLVLWLLRRAEAIARDFVIGDEEMLAPGLSPAALASSGNRPEDALYLAEVFRALAWLLEAQIGPLCTQGDGRAGRTGEARVRRAAAGEKTLAALAALARVALARPHRVAAPDTS